MSIKGSKTEQNLKTHSRASRRRIVATSTSPRRPTWKDTTMSRRCSALLRKGRRGMRMATSSISKQVATPRQVSPSAVPPTISRPPSPERPTSTPTCTRAWRRVHGTRIRRDRRLVRDPRQAETLPRQPLPEGSRQPGLLTLRLRIFRALRGSGADPSSRLAGGRERR